jgi:hypothetical protein
MVVTPADIPETKPLPEPIVATPALVLVHVPPEVRSDNVVVNPKHTPSAPVIEAGVAFTVTVTLAVLTQPLLFVPVTVYIIVVVGFAVTLAQVVQDNPIAGDHT